MIREEIILEYVRGKDTLDIGSVGQDIDFIHHNVIDKSEGEETQKFLLWNRMKEVAKSLTGIDLESSSSEGIIQGNMETHQFNRQFDVIVAGDILEHVDNQGLFLANVARHLKPDGKFIITTPNAKWPTVFLKPNPTHTLWHDWYTLSEILSRYQFKIVRFQFYPGNKPHYSLWKRPLVWRQGMLAICELESKSAELKS